MIESLVGFVRLTTQTYLFFDFIPAIGMKCKANWILRPWKYKFGFVVGGPTGFNVSRHSCPLHTMIRHQDFRSGIIIVIYIVISKYHRVRRLLIGSQIKEMSTTICMMESVTISGNSCSTHIKMILERWCISFI